MESLGFVFFTKPRLLERLAHYQWMNGVTYCSGDPFSWKIFVDRISSSIFYLMEDI